MVGPQGPKGDKGDAGSDGSPWGGGTFTGNVTTQNLYVDGGYQKIHGSGKDAYLDFKTSDTSTNADSRFFRMDLQSGLDRMAMHMVDANGTTVGAGLLITRSGTSGVINEDGGGIGSMAVYPTHSTNGNPGNAKVMLGTPFQRWHTVYAKSAQWPSDERLKQDINDLTEACLLYTSPSPRDGLLSRMPSSA